LEDVRAGKIDVIVVYKVDRLTRSLADFAKLVELFDEHNVSFVSVTQQFNTTTSMGRLTLNVLLSFAQFEREVTSERIRDKISASKRKGLWVGGMTPLGYDAKDRKITVNAAEADRVRTIFRSYLKLASLNLLMADLRKRGIVTKVRKLRTGESIGGIPFTRGSLAQLLRNRFYIGEVAFKGEVLKGEQPAILDRALFDAVQAKLNEQVTNHNAKWMKSEALLAGRIFDDRGNRMTPSHARRGNVKYRYYLSSALLQGMAERAGSVRRVPATDVETLVVKSVREHLKPSQPIDDRSLINTRVARVEVQPNQLVIRLTGERKKTRANGALHVPWQRTLSTRRREILLPKGMPPQDARPIRSETRATLVAAVARGRRWLDELTTDASITTENIAKREGCSVRKVNMTISLAFLAPDLVKAAIDGRLPHGMGFARLTDLPAEWSRQHEMLGLPSH
jgi:site-specific DNA recombinase